MREVPSLGGLVGAWIQDRLAVPDGDRQGEPFRLTGDQWDFLLRFYAVTDRGEFVHRRGGMIVRPQKAGKSPLAAAVIAAEALGPVRFHGFDADGQPFGRAVATPWIQVAAVSESQTANTWKALLPMLQLGDVGDQVEDIGLTRITLPGGGRIEFVTAAHRSRVGARPTFQVWDELGFWLPGNHGHDLADAMGRNLAGMASRFLGTTNAWSLNEDSVAERIAAEAGVYLDDVEPGRYSIRNRRERRKALERVYGDAAAGCEAQGNAEGFIDPWVDLDAIDAGVDSLIGRDEPQARRFYFNEKLAASAAAFDGARFAELANEGYTPAHGAQVVLTVDGAHSRDALAVIATEIETGFQWPVAIETRPENAPDDYRHDLDAVDAAVTQAWERFDVHSIRIDPQFIEPLVVRWQSRWGDEKVIPFYTNTQVASIAHAVRRFSEAIGSGELSHDGDPVLVAHVRNAVRRPVHVRDDDDRPMHVIQKDHPSSPRKIDAAMAAVLGWEARYEIQRTDDTPPPRTSAAYVGNKGYYSVNGEGVGYEAYLEAKAAEDAFLERHGDSADRRPGAVEFS